LSICSFGIQNKLLEVFITDIQAGTTMFQFVHLSQGTRKH